MSNIYLGLSVPYCHYVYMLLNSSARVTALHHTHACGIRGVPRCGTSGHLLCCMPLGMYAQQAVLFGTRSTLNIKPATGLPNESCLDY